ncbi:MAG: hypothetical protein R3264_09890, partial [Anaerolineae bacterium]|nr:hypothetical protein [Anaerolineae bacterium]
LRWSEKRQKRPKRAIEFFLVASRFELAPDPTLEEVKAHTHLVRDATDVPIVLSAIKARVDYLVTNDQDFHDEYTKSELEKQGVRVVLVGTFLADVMHWKSEDLEAIRSRDWQDVLP